MTNLSVLIAYTAAALSGCLGVLALFRVRRSIAHAMFAVGMLGLAAEAAFSGLCLQSLGYADLVRWQHLRFAVASILPGGWLLFSLCYARENYREFLRRWRWAIALAFAAPVVLVLLGPARLFAEIIQTSLLQTYGIRLAWAGYLFQVVMLLSAVAIVAVLERTLRASYAKMRWRIKFLLLGIGGLFAIRVYTSSQAVLFSFLDADLLVINAGALIAADLLIVYSLVRARLREVSVYVSPAAVRSSLTVLIAGIYLLAIGLSAKLARHLGVGEAILQNAFFVFLGILGLVVIMLSDQLRNEVRRFLARHFRQPLYDYRRLWTVFTHRTSGLVDQQELGRAVVNTVSETFGCSAVSIWLVDEMRQRPGFCASTFLAEGYPIDFQRNEAEVAILMPLMQERELPVDLRDSGDFDVSDLTRDATGAVPEDTIRYCVPLTVGTEFLGMMTLNERMTGDALSIEDLDLLKTIGDQTAGLLLNSRLYQRLGQAKEREAFQTLSAFFVHDLKNLASTLSLTLQNLPLHYDNPEFREDMLRVISQSVKKVDSLCGRLSAFRETIQLEREESDLAELVRSTLADLDGALGARLIVDLQPVPALSMDRGQMQKVLVNLVLNANEATEKDGEIRVATRRERDFAALEVRDSGCGMTPEFLKGSLFHPFKTTKDRGLGIGLYQCKMIVEAHRGRIEVESEEGQGSLFRVLLPLP